MKYPSLLLGKFLFYFYIRLEFPADACRRVTETYPDTDCVFLNAGVQRPHDFSVPEKIDLQAFFAEFNVNFTSLVSLVHAFLPYLKGKASETSFIL
jgi:short-subunit dehydrogenase involved in D-alanine esterification of teichoic acids